MHKVVLDTNILVSALWSKQGNPNKIVEMVFTNEIVPFFNSEIIEEYNEVLFRPKFNLPKDKLLNLLRELIINGVIAESVQSNILFTDDSDRKFYDMAKSNKAVLITGNLKHYPDEPLIMSPFEFLQKLTS